MIPFDLYPLVYLAAIFFSVSSAFASANRKKSKILSFGFNVAIILYLFNMVMNYQYLSQPIWLVLLRDFAVLHIFTFLAGKLARPKTRMLVASIIGITLLSIFYNKVLLPTFSKQKNLAQLDNNAELLVDLQTDNPRLVAQIKRELAQYDLSFTKAFPNIKNLNYSNLDDYYVVNIPDKHQSKIPSIIQQLQQLEAVDWAERNEIVPLYTPLTATLPQPTRSNYIVNDPDLDKVWGFEQMKVNDLHKFLKSNRIKPKKTARIFILDTGVDAEHEDLKANFKSVGTKNDKDRAGHGTHCAGIAGAVSNNKLGIASFSPDNNFVTISSVKVLGDFGGGTQQQIIAGMITAADKGADVVSMSLGGASNDTRQKAYNEAVKYVQKSGGIVVVAAGNSNQSATLHVPAACEGVITVTAVDEQLNKAKFSNHISDAKIKRGIAAPGVNVYSTVPNNGYKPMNGTSMATPYVAGLLGLLKAIKPNLTTDEAYNILHETGIETGSTDLTGKFIQPKAAVEKAAKKGWF